MKDVCVKLSGIGALLICIPVIYRIHEGDLFNPASYFLWSLLSLVCVVVLWRAKKGGHIMLAGYFLSDLSIGAYAYVKSGRASFGQFEWFIVILTALCAVIYVLCELQKNFRPAVIMNGVACIVAGVPQVIDTFGNPYQMSYMICVLYLLISILAYYGERNFNGKFIPGLSIIYWIIFIAGITIAR